MTLSDVFMIGCFSLFHRLRVSYSHLWIQQLRHLIANGVHYKNRINYVFRDEVEKKEEEYSSNG